MNEEANKRLGNLIFSLAHGNIAALADIYMLMVKILYAVGNIYFTQRADIEDAIQDLLILLYDNAHKFKRNKNACAWIIKLYQNMIYKNLKKRKSEDNYISEQIQLQNITSLEDNSKYIEKLMRILDSEIWISDIREEVRERRMAFKCKQPLTI